jgi:uncharacterized protein YeaO (DUF488 family)
MPLKLKRAYEPAHPDDGTRILVDRLWPRGITKDSAGIDLWLKDVAPSNELRKWSHADPSRYDEFRKRYAQELDANPDGLAVLLAMLQKGAVTLNSAAKAEEQNNAVALTEYIEKKQTKKPGAKRKTA